ncbi:MAG: 6-bladed beta-propeller [Candidatus Aminicenantes bacterium]|nr:MAG: 6-bladed beta-propeller [Candidatus Aminicenantes bacterium]
MKKIAWLAILLLVIGGCSMRENRVEKVMEDGIEVVLNGTEPYNLPDVQSPVGLEEEWIIDLEAEDVSNAGLYQIDTFAVDVGGSVYILNLRPEKDHIFKFTQDGKFDKSFGMHGQGPGEFGRPNAVTLTPDQELMIVDPDNAKLVYLTREGELIREVTLNRNIPFVQPLSDSRFVVFGRMRPDIEKRFVKYPLELCDENIEPIRMLDEYRMENFRVTRRFRGTQPGFALAVGGSRVFIGNEARDYEIWVYDGEGTLIKKIRKEHHPLPVTEAIKEKALARYDDNVKPMVFFPENLPPFRTMAADGEGTLYVVTFEEGNQPGENRIDVFSPEGAFVGRLSAAVFVSPSTPIDAVACHGRFYYIRETESGFKQLVAERIITQ